MPPIIQPKIHTKVTIYFQSGHWTQFIWPNERHTLPTGKALVEDRDGIQHYLNPDHIVHFMLEHVPADAV